MCRTTLVVSLRCLGVGAEGKGQGTHGTGKTGKMKIPSQGKHREFENFAKIQGILFVQVVDSLILKVRDIVIFAVKITIFSFSWIDLPSNFVYAVVTNYVNWHMENLWLDREKTGKTE